MLRLLRRRRAPRPLVEMPVPRAGSWTLPGVPPRFVVRLGFADGTEVELPEQSREARAMHAVADGLVGDQGLGQSGR